MAAIFQTTFSNAFSWMKIYEFWLIFHLILFLTAKLKYFSIGLHDAFVPTRLQAIIWTNDGKFTDIYLRHLASMS